MDKTAPSAPTSMSYVFSDWTGYTNNTWTNRDVYAAQTTSNPGPTGSTDSYSGVAKYQISSDGSNWIDYVYDSTNSMYYMSGNGTHTRYFRAVDYAGNVSASISRVAKIDKIAPSAPKISNPTNGSWTNQDIVLTLSSTDTGGSGIKYYQYSYDNSSWTQYENSAATTFNTTAFSAQRNQLAYINVCDNAGNCSTSSSTYIRIDKTPPTITMSPATGTYTSGTMYVVVTCSDSLSGMKEAWLSDAGYVTTDVERTSQILSSIKSRTAEGKCTDNVGNVATTSVYYNIVSSGSGGKSCTTYYGRTAEECYNNKWTVIKCPTGSNCTCQSC